MKGNIEDYIERSKRLILKEIENRILKEIE